MKRLISLLLLSSLLLTLPVHAADTDAASLWSRVEPGGAYVTCRLPYPEGDELLWSDQNALYVRYADTKEPVALSSQYLRGALYATVPVNQAARTLEVVQGEATKFEDCYAVWTQNGLTHKSYSNAPLGTDALNLRGLFLGDGSGNLHPDAVITRAEAFTVLCRLLGIPLEGEVWSDWYYVNSQSTGFADVAPSAWYYPTAAAAKVYGLTNEPTYFRPDDLVTRGEFTVMLDRAMKQIGWLAEGKEAKELSFKDADSIPDWAKEAYLALEPHSVRMETLRDSQIIGEFGPEQDSYAEHALGATRGEVIEAVYDALRWLPCYPTQTAIDWGFDQVMPVIDGSTSTYPYTQAVYGALFSNYDNHASYPASHSKSYYSYDRLISGEADILFISTKPTEDTLRKAKAAGVELELIPIAHDAMVFFTNGANPVEGLTSAQIQSVYIENKYTNWNQLGGPDAKFIPYCRNMDSGSQAQMEEFFLHGSAIHPDIKRETTSVSMASVLTNVWEAHSESPLTYALGYSIYYYYQASSPILLSSDNDLKLLAIDGVYPTAETIADGSYPLAGYNYAVVRSDEPEGSPARRMVEFMLSGAGQDCVVSAGFGALTPTPTAFLTELKEADVTAVNWAFERADHPTAAGIVSLLNAAADNITQEPEGEKALTFWALDLTLAPNRFSVTDSTLTLSAGSAENKVNISSWSSGVPFESVWVESPSLYRIVRACMDTPDGPVDEAALAKYRTEVELHLEVPQQTGNAVTYRNEATSFYLLTENKAISAQAYALNFVKIVTPAEKAYVLLAGGEYLDSTLRIHDDDGGCLLVVDGQSRGFYSREWVEKNLTGFQTQAELLAALHAK